MNKSIFCVALAVIATVSLLGCKSKEEEQEQASREALEKFFDNKTTRVRTLEEIRAQKREEQEKAKGIQK